MAWRTLREVLWQTVDFCALPMWTVLFYFLALRAFGVIETFEKGQTAVVIAALIPFAYFLLLVVVTILRVACREARARKVADREARERGEPEWWE